MTGYRNRNRESFLPPDAAAADLATTSRFVGGGAESEGAINSLRRQLHLPTPVDCPLGNIRRLEYSSLEKGEISDYRTYHTHNGQKRKNGHVAERTSGGAFSWSQAASSS
eukprot:g6604.t1